MWKLNTIVVRNVSVPVIDSCLIDIYTENGVININTFEWMCEISKE